MMALSPTESGRSCRTTTLSASGVASRKGDAGCEFNSTIGSKYQVRHRTLAADLGRWSLRDFVEYPDGYNAYEYAHSNPIRFVDPFGLRIIPITDKAACLVRCLTERSKTFRDIKHELDNDGKRQTVGTMTPVGSEPSSGGTNGYCDPQTDGDGNYTGDSDSMVDSHPPPTGSDPALTMAHEMGHARDYSNARGQCESPTNPPEKGGAAVQDAVFKDLVTNRTVKNPLHPCPQCGP